MSSAGFVASAEVQRDPHIAPVELRRLDESLDAVHGVGGQPHQQIRGFQRVR